MVFESMLERLCFDVLVEACLKHFLDSGAGWNLACSSTEKRVLLMNSWVHHRSDVPCIHDKLKAIKIIATRVS